MENKIQVGKKPVIMIEKTERNNNVHNAVLDFTKNILDDDRIHITVRREYRNKLIELLDII